MLGSWDEVWFLPASPNTRRLAERLTPYELPPLVTIRHWSIGDLKSPLPNRSAHIDVFSVDSQIKPLCLDSSTFPSLHHDPLEFLFLGRKGNCSQLQEAGEKRQGGLHCPVSALWGNQPPPSPLTSHSLPWASTNPDAGVGFFGSRTLDKPWRARRLFGRRRQAQEGSGEVRKEGETPKIAKKACG